MIMAGGGRSLISLQYTGISLQYPRYPSGRPFPTAHCPPDLGPLGLIGMKSYPTTFNFLAARMATRLITIAMYPTYW